MFNLGDYVVCPGHGVGQVCSVDSKEISGELKSFYIVKIISNGMKIMVPTDSKEGLRSLILSSQVKEIFELLKDQDVKVDTSTWNRRHRDYTLKVKTGSLLEIADVLRQLLLLKMSKKLSFGERKMLEQCKDLIIQEVSLATGSAAEELHQKIDSLYED